MPFEKAGTYEPISQGFREDHDIASPLSMLPGLKFGDVSPNHHTPKGDDRRKLNPAAVSRSPRNKRARPSRAFPGIQCVSCKTKGYDHL